MHRVGYAHTDLKLDNIGIKSCNTTTIRWLDPVTGFHKKVFFLPFCGFIDTLTIFEFPRRISSFARKFVF